MKTRSAILQSWSGLLHFPLAEAPAKASIPKEGLGYARMCIWCVWKHFTSRRVPELWAELPAGIPSTAPRWHRTTLAHFPHQPACTWSLGFTLTKITLCTWWCLEPSNQLFPVFRWFGYVKAPSTEKGTERIGDGGGACCIWSWGSSQKVWEEKKAV